MLNDKVWAKVRRDLFKPPKQPNPTVSLGSSSESDSDKETTSIPSQDRFVDEYEAEEMEATEDVLNPEEVQYVDQLIEMLERQGHLSESDKSDDEYPDCGNDRKPSTASGLILVFMSRFKTVCLIIFQTGYLE